MPRQGAEIHKNKTRQAVKDLSEIKAGINVAEI